MADDDLVESTHEEENQSERSDRFSLGTKREETTDLDKR